MLVITIVVIIILAGAVILSLSQNNPINQAREARFKTDMEAFNSELLLWLANEYGKSLGSIDLSKIDANKTTGTYNNLKIQEIITTMSDNYADKFEIQSGKLVYVGNDNNEKTWLSGSNVGISTPKSIDVATPYKKANTAGTEASPGTPLSEHSTINGQMPSYSNPVIPAGFMAVNTADASWNNSSTDWNKGLVIQDASGNQFVWVPVDGTNVPYAKWCTSVYAYNDPNILGDVTPTGFNVNNITTTYQGFYIARYEAMFDYNGGSARVASKKSINKETAVWSRDSAHTGYLFNFADYDDSKSYAENMGTIYGYNTTLVNTNLVTGTQWDTVMKWIQNSGKNVVDSRSWGNHNDSISPANISGFGSLQASGYSDNWKSKNIYDLAGNTIEWTGEKWGTGFVFRGGTCVDSGVSYPAATRDGDNDNSTQSSEYMSFRVALDIK